MPYLRALLGIAFFCAVAWALSSHKKRFPWRVVIFGLSLQVALGLLIPKTGPGRAFFDGIATFVQKLIARTAPGSEMVFGDLAKADGTTGFIFAFASSGLIVILFFSALMSVLYHLGIMQVIIWVLARVMSATMGVSGAEAMAMAANVFVGQTEAPLVVKPYIPNMTMSELNAMMTGGFATIAGSVLALYMGFLGLAWDDSVLGYAEHARDRGHINTPSYAQVTQPIYDRARFRWLRYAAHLAPVMDTLAPFIEHFGYGQE